MLDSSAQGDLFEIDAGRDDLHRLEGEITGLL